jgi:C-8 sterol isomerase
MAGVWGFVVLLVGLLIGLYSYLDTQLENFYIFQPDQLHELAKRAIDAHGNDTRAVVSYIVDDLKTQSYDKHINFDQEWVFNNAGGAMGAMYIIHASKFI